MIMHWLKKHITTLLFVGFFIPIALDYFIPINETLITYLSLTSLTLIGLHSWLQNKLATKNFCEMGKKSWNSMPGMGNMDMFYNEIEGRRPVKIIGIFFALGGILGLIYTTYNLLIHT